MVSHGSPPLQNEQDEAEAALGAYDQAFTLGSTLSGGVINKVWRVEGPEGLFVLKRYRYKGLMQVRRSLDVQEAARKGGIPVPVVYTNRQGDPATLVGDTPFVLSEFVSGRTFAPDNVPSAAARRMGEVLARLHASLRSLPPGDPPVTPKRSTIEGILRLLLAIADQRLSNPVDARAAQNLKAKLSLLSRLGDAPAMTGQWSHGDYEWRNILFDTSDNITSVIDFDDACYRHPGRDLMRCIALTFPSLGSEAEDFFSGYASFSDITPEVARGYVEYYRYAISTRVWPISERYLAPRHYQARWDEWIQPLPDWDWDELANRFALIAEQVASSRST